MALAVVASGADATPKADADAIILADVFLQSAVESVVETQCGSSRGLQNVIDLGLGAWLSHDPGLSEERARDVRLRLRRSDSHLGKLCNDMLASALNSPDGPFHNVKDSAIAVFDAIEPADRAEFAKFITSRAGAEVARSTEALGNILEDAWAKWMAQSGTVVLETMVRTAATNLDDWSQSTRSPLQAKRVDGESSAETPIVRPQTQGKLISARQRNQGSLGAACQSFYPTPSRVLGEEGSVVLLVYVAADGHLTSVQVERSSGYPALDVAAAACVGAAAQFAPLQSDGQPVGSWQRMKWVWRLEEDRKELTPATSHH